MRKIYAIKNFAKNIRCAHHSGQTPYMFSFVIIELNLCQIYQLELITLHQYLHVSSHNSGRTIVVSREY